MSGVKHICESKEDVSAIGCEFLGLSSGPCAGAEPNSVDSEDLTSTEPEIDFMPRFK